MATEQAPMPARYRILVAILFFSLVGLLLWEFLPLSARTTGREYRVTLNIKSDPPIRSVKCHLVINEAHGRKVLKEAEQDDSSWDWSAKSDPFNGDPLTVDVYVSIDESPLLRRELKRLHLWTIVVLVEYENGDKVTKFVEVPPESEAQRPVTVDVP